MMKELGFEGHGARGGAVLRDPVVRLDEVVQLEPLVGGEGLRREGREPLLEHQRAQDDMAEEMAGGGIVESALQLRTNAASLA